MATDTVEKVSKTGKAVKGANFKNKRERKAYRKTLRQVIANKAANKALDKEEKKEQFRKIKLVKLRRRKIARDWLRLLEAVQALASEVGRVPDRIPGADPRFYGVASSFANDAAKAVAEKADQYAAFSRKDVRIYKPAGKG
ncbi:hypothetical protein ACFWNN_45345 [Lentzea sp. NPDC058450]|uniref:hypothetical protein n=1 Tax=Lentzea sp. NPDC058450 TaxID=3346505 RepID=UPI003659119F